MSAAEDKVSVRIEGIENKELRAVLLNSVRLHRQRNHPRLTAARIKALHETAAAEIQRALQAYGYYKARVEGRLEAEGDRARAVYVVAKGQPVLVQDVLISLTGPVETPADFQHEIVKFPLRRGDVFKHAAYEAGKQRLLRFANDEGYLDAVYRQHEARIDLAKSKVTITLELSPGPRYRFGAVRFEETVINQALLERLLPFQSGDPYSTHKLTTLQNRLIDTDYFELVEVRPRVESAAGLAVPVEVALKVRKRNRYSAGAGFGTDSGPRVAFGWDARYLNRKGHRFNLDARLSPVISDILGEYTIPFIHRQDTEFGISTEVSREDTDSRLSELAVAGINYKQRRWFLDEIASLRYLYEQFEVGTEDSSARLLIPGISWIYTKTDDPVYTEKGFRLGLTLRGAHATVLSDTSFLQAVLQGKFVRGISDFGRVIVRGDFGATGVSDFGKFPGSLRFYAGGDNSVRGFDFEELGPRDSSGEVVGGKFLAVGSLEYEHHVFDKWGVAVFGDVGNAFDSFSERLEYSTGAGLRWRSPIGQVRVDVAVGISEEDPPVRVHIVVGPDL